MENFLIRNIHLKYLDLLS